MRTIILTCATGLLLWTCAGRKQTAVAAPPPPAAVQEPVPTAGPGSGIARTPMPEPVPLPPVEKSITWLDFETGYNKAVQENKILLVDVYTDWCYWCKVMDRETYTDTQVIEKVNRHFVTVKLNPEKNGTFRFADTTMDNVELFRWLGYGNTYGFPTTYFWLHPGKTAERYSLAGYNEPADFLPILDKIIVKKGLK